MKKQLLSFNGLRSVALLLVLWSCAAMVSGQNTTPFSPAHTFNVQPGHNSIGPAHHYTPSPLARVLCDTDVLLDYSTYNEIDAIHHHIGYNGSWNNIVNVYARQISGLLTRPEVDSFSADAYAGVIFDTLAFGNITDSVNTSLVLANTTVYLDKLRFFGGLSGDSTRMANDSLMFTIYGITGGNAAIVKTIVYKGMSQLRQFYLLPNYLQEFEIPVQQQFAQGESFAVRVDFLNKDTSGHFLLSYSYPDSCGTIVYGGTTYPSPAHVSSFPGTSFWGLQKDTLVNSVTVDPQSSAFAYNLTGIPLNCSYVYEQNWEIIPVITVCQAAANIAPSVITTGATSVTAGAAVLNGSVNANGISTTTGFQWGLTTGYTGGTVTGVPSPLTGSTYAGTTYALSGLAASTTYHYRASATNSVGTTYGRDTTFTTSAATAQVCDTLFNERSPLDTAFIIRANPSGFLAGNNYYSDVAKAEGFASVIGYHVTSADLYFGHASYLPADANKPVKIKIWDNTGISNQGYPGAPGNAIDSTTATLSQISTAVTGNLPVIVTFPHNVAITTDTFYVGVVLPTTAGDTVALITNNASGPDGNGWELDSASGWASYNNDWGFTSGSVGNYIIVDICPAATAPAVTVTPGNVNCYGLSTGSLTANASGGNGTFTYAWSNGATSSSVSNVAAGNYTVTVTSGGVTATATATVTQPASALTTAPSSTQTLCSSNTGTATANAAGGTIAYTYLWSNGATLASISGLGAATYTLTVTDSKGCSVTGSTTVSRPAAFSVSVSVNNVLCYGQSTGSATANTTGATGNLTYAWNSGNTQTISNLPAGNYNVTVTDANGCSSSASASVTQTGTAVTASASSTQTSCGSGTGTATVTPGGGTPGYTYSWSNSGTSITISNLPVGNYNVTVTDSHSCTASASTSVNTSATFVVNVSSTNVNCFGQSTGTATASATGTTGAVVYAWSNSSTSQNLTGLAAGTYNVTVTDASACPKTNSVTITQPSSALSASVTTNPTGCSSNSGSATASVTGGTPSYTYAWSNSTTSNPVSGLAAGSVSVTVTDSKGCSVTGSGNVATPPSFTVSTTPTSVSCNGQSSGSVNSAVTGNGSYTYFWSNGSTSSTITNVTAGQYSLTVTDAFGCSVTSSSTVNQPSALQVSATSTDANNGHNGTATAGATGGTTPYQFSWSNGGTTLAITGLAAGNYTVTITDANNCSGSATTTIIATDINSVASNITGITLIPNPANDVVKVVVSLGNAQTVDVKLVDLAGKYIYTAHESAFQGTITHQINVGEYAAGIYLVEITAGNEVMRKKLVITK